VALVCTSIGGPDENRSTIEDITTVMLNPRRTLPTFYAIDLRILFQFVLIKIGIIIFGHPHLHRWWRGVVVASLV